MQATELVSPDTTLEASLLKVFAVREQYNTFMSQIDVKRLLQNTELLLKDYGKYFDLYKDHASIDFGLFYTQFSQDWHINSLTTDQIEYYRDYVFPAIKAAQPESVESCLISLIKQKTLEDLSNNTSELNPSKIKELLDDFERKMSMFSDKSGPENDPDAVLVQDIDLNSLDKSKGIPQCLPELQKSLGGLVKGEFNLVAAATNAGKSAFCISQVVSTLIHLKEINNESPILYFNSEGTQDEIYGRVFSNLYRHTYVEGFEEIKEKEIDVKELYNNEYNNSSFILFQISTHKLNFIESKIKRYKPALVVIDMIDALSEAEDNLTLKKLYDDIRRLSLEYCPIIGTTQAGSLEYYDESEHKNKTKRFLGIKDVLNCKAKAAAVTNFIGIGMDYDQPGVRFISTPKVKRGTPINFSCELINKYSLYKPLAW